MAGPRPQIITEDSASGAQIIDGSLKFSYGDWPTFLYRTPGSAGNTSTWTFNSWWKFSGANQGTSGAIFGCRPGSSNDTTFAVRYETDGTFKMTTEAELLFQTTQVFRDPCGWQMLTFVLDTGNGTAGDRFKMYVNMDFSNSPRILTHDFGNV